MSANKWTPGPWIHWADTNLVIRLHGGAARREDLRICEVSTNTRKDEGRYNARLIAAAPTLLDACEAAWNCVIELPPSNATSELVRMLADALARARGES
jgi:hypothetical protein